VSDTLTVGDTPTVHLALVLDPRDGSAFGAAAGREVPPVAASHWNGGLSQGKQSGQTAPP
jgi:hypothetical protein